MKRSVLLVPILLAGVSVFAQQAATLDPVAIPVEQEPRHRLVFSNEFVRIIDAVLPPLYVSLNHAHTHDNVAVTILPGLEGPQGAARIGFAGFSRGGYSHVITNPNNALMRFIDVELYAGDRPLPPAGDFMDQANHIIVLNNTRVRIARVKIAAGEALAGHHHAAGYVSVTVRGGDGPGTWRWHGAGEAAAALEAGRQPLEIVEIEPK